MVLALALLAGAFLFPQAAFAASDDTIPPTVTVEVNDGILKAAAKDDTAVASIFIGGSRFSTLVNGTATVRLKDYAGTGKQVEIYATDTAGNKSQPVLIDNPYYQAPATSQPQASAPQSQAPQTQAPASSAPTTSRPASTSDGSAPASSTPTPSASAPAASTPVPEPSAPASSIPEAQPPAATDGAGSESAIPNGPNAFTPDGGGTVQDNATEGDGKEFFTVTTTDGSVYYLIIDRQRGTQNVYFLSAVTKDDLLGLAQDGSAAATPGLSQPEPQTPGASQTEQPSPTPQPEQPKQDNGGGNMGTILFILIAAAVAGGAGYYFKIIKPRKQAAQEDEYEEYEDEPDEESPDEDEYFFEDDETQPDEKD
jgi:hypothetical protein